MPRFLVALVFLLLSIAAPAAASDDTAKDAARKVIEHQLAAFARDDAEEAYSDAAPRIRAIFTDPHEFLLMVAAAYPAVYNHCAVEFRDAAEADDHVAELVLFTDDDGKVWQAIYKLEKQPDGRWMISGCVVRASAEQGL